MANTAQLTVTKRLLQAESDIINAKKRLVHNDKTSIELLSKEEKKLLHLDRWFRPKAQRRRCSAKLVAQTKDFYYHGLRFVREAYLSISGTGSDDMMELLKDEAAMRALFRFSAFLRLMREYSLCMRAIKNDLLMKLEGLSLDGSVTGWELARTLKGKCPRCSLIHEQVSLVPSAKPRELESSGNGKAITCSAVNIEGDDKFSIKVYNMLLILNEMLNQMGFQSKDVQGYGHAELTEVVQDRMSLLRIEIKQTETMLIDLINSVEKVEFVSTADELRLKLSSLLKLGIQRISTFLSTDKEIRTAFKKLIEFLDDIWLSSDTGKKGRYFQYRDAVIEWKKQISTPWTAEMFKEKFPMLCE